MTETKTKNKYPSAVYAAAGVGDLVYQQLRKLQDKAVAFGNEQAPQWKQKVAGLSTKVDANKVRDSVVTGTQAAAERATKVYETLVARGEKAFRAEQPAATKAEQPAATKAEPATPATRRDETPARPAVAKKAQPRKRPTA